VTALERVHLQGDEERLQGEMPRSTNLRVKVRRQSLHDTRAADDLAGETELFGCRSSTAA